MGKRIQVTAEIEAKLRSAISDPNFDVSKVAVYETRALSTEAITQDGLFSGARVNHSVLKEMADLLSKADESVPLIIMHRGGMLPVGRVFSAGQFLMENGETELRVLFYVPLDKPEYVNDIDNSLINEVSVSVQFKHAFCSECGFDYMGLDADYENFWYARCNEGHIIGNEGTHLRLVGLDKWRELSLVDRGAAKDAKIMAEGRRKLAASARPHSSEALAAGAGHDAKAVFLNASFSMNEESSTQKPIAKDDPIMANEIMTLSAALADEKVKVALAEKASAELTEALKSKDVELQAALAKVKQLEEASAKGQETLLAEKEKAEKALQAAQDKMIPHVKAALVASGLKESDVPADLTAMLALVEEKGMKLHQLVSAGTGGVSADLKTDLKAQEDASGARKSFKLS